MLMHAPENCANVSIDGVTYKVDAEGICEVPNELVEVAKSHGFSISKNQVQTVTLTNTAPVPTIDIDEVPIPQPSDADLALIAEMAKQAMANKSE
jgi:hypothetical protein